MKLGFCTDFVGRPPRPFKRGNFYYIRHRVGRVDAWRSLRTSDRKEAEMMAVNIWREWQNEVSQRVIPAVSLPIRMVLDLYSESPEFTRLAESTRRSKLTWLSKLLAWTESRRVQYPEQLTADLAVSFLETCGKTNKTFNTVCADCRAAFAVGRASINAFASIPPRDIHAAGSRASTQHRAFTDEEVERILSGLLTSRLRHREEWHMAALIASQTGLRYKDVAFLRWTAIQTDERGRYIEVAPAKTESRTGGKVVYIRLTRRLDQALTEWQRRFRVIPAQVLPGLAEAYGPNSSADFNHFCKSLGIDATFHSFRVSLATKAAKAGIDLVEFGGVLGHTTVQQTQAYNRAALQIDMEAVAEVGV